MQPLSVTTISQDNAPGQVDACCGEEVMVDSYRLIIKCPAKQDTRSSALWSEFASNLYQANISFLLCKETILELLSHLPVLSSHNIAIWWLLTSWWWVLSYFGRGWVIYWSKNVSSQKESGQKMQRFAEAFCRRQEKLSENTYRVLCTYLCTHACHRACTRARRRYPYAYFVGMKHSTDIALSFLSLSVICWVSVPKYPWQHLHIFWLWEKFYSYSSPYILTCN